MLSSSVRRRLHEPLRLLTRLAVWLVGVLLLTVFVYREHVMHGQVSSPEFPPQRIVSMTLAGDEILLALIPTDRILGLTWLAGRPALFPQRGDRPPGPAQGQRQRRTG